MTPDQTARSYDQLASRWAGEEFDRSNGIAQHRRALQFAAHRHRALDAGCGSSGRIIDLLLTAGYEVEGLDISSEMLGLARERHPAVTFHQADICTWNVPGKYDFISAWDSIWHAPLAEHEGVLAKLCDALAPGGVLIFTTGGVDQPEDSVSSFMDHP